MRRFVLATAAALLIASPAAAGTWRCQPVQKVACSGGDSCPAAATAGAYNRIDFAQNQYSRCDDKGCDPYRAVISKSGAFINIEVPGRSMLAKMTEDGKAYLEVFTVLGTVVVSHGICAPEQ